MDETTENPLTRQLHAACDELEAGCLPDAEARDLVVRSVRTFIGNPSPQRDAMLRQAGKQERDRLLAELAEQHCADIDSVRGKAHQILTWAGRYQATGWLCERHTLTCPEHRIGKPEALIWAALRAYETMPGERRLHEIITETMS